ncbi:unnamed protein product [Symbiodinium sp. CCMP2592]|nr:unnamed protein product [Symbiodinium sp. CCMP2592]
MGVHAAETDSHQRDGFEQWRSFKADIERVPGIQEGQQRLKKCMLDASGFVGCKWLDETLPTMHGMDMFVGQANDQTKGAKPPQGIEGAMALTSPNDLKVAFEMLDASKEGVLGKKQARSSITGISAWMLAGGCCQSCMASHSPWACLITKTERVRRSRKVEPRAHRPERSSPAVRQTRADLASMILVAHDACLSPYLHWNILCAALPIQQP